jgi:hypothetical protein
VLSFAYHLLSWKRLPHDARIVSLTVPLGKFSAYLTHAKSWPERSSIRRPSEPIAGLQSSRLER